MYSLIAPLAFAAVVSAIEPGTKPPGGSPAGCESTIPGTFGFDAYYVSNPKAKRQMGVGNPTGYTLTDGVIKDSLGRVANVVANSQFQFDPAPGQADALYNAGFSICQNNSIAIGNRAIWTACPSGGFNNFYLDNSAPQCKPVYLVVSRSTGGSGGSAGSTQKPDGQLGATQISDGQIQAPTNLASQIADGQIQGTPKAGATQIPDGQVQGSPKAGATQIADGQVQGSPKAGATQIADGQVQGSPKAGATQIPDGQVQGTPKAGATQIADGQIQGTPKAAAPAPSNSTKPAPAPAPFTGAGSAVRGDLLALVGAGFMAILLL